MVFAWNALSPQAISWNGYLIDMHGCSERLTIE